MNLRAWQGTVRAVLAMLLLWASPVSAQTRPSAPISLWRLDCGSVDVPDLDFLSDTFAFSGQSKTVAVSCYLIRHGDRYMLWDAGLPLSRLGAGQRSVGGGQARLTRPLVEQLADLKLTPAAISILALSHYHADHAGQAASFPAATLMIGAEDWAVVGAATAPFNLDRSQFAPWTPGGGKVDPVSGDRDVFGDGSVILLATPGHTPGHHSLMARLPGGPVLLSGDLWHFAEQMPINGVPKINTSRADTLASMDRVRRIADNLKGTIILGHEPADIAKLPAFPRAAGAP
jgi:glyoxylase-like metal-dependent hydrolase (beta-lactamase superfamily II)